MARWLEGIQEAAFRPAAAGGHIFMSPHPWLFARPRYYLVNNVQKATIVEYLRRRALLALWFIPVAFVLIAVFFGLLAYGALPRLSPILAGVSFAAVLFLPMVIVPHVYLMRKLAPVVRNLPRSDQKFTVGQQFGGVARAMPKWLVYAGMAGGILMILGAFMGMYDLYSEARPAARWIAPMTSMAGGIIFVAYFAYLASLKKKMPSAL
jgi:hypothetical protein